MKKQDKNLVRVQFLATPTEIAEATGYAKQELMSFSRYVRLAVVAYNAFMKERK